ncbi:MAG: chemotaxis-specific protein-glutamate methyltransferase CheB [Synechococcaceae cyanobacterium]|nr:chemotaxis-specific protein-glutamate methyltransferase CheB [Synechococcaceae cyanobacterium]
MRIAIVNDLSLAVLAIRRVLEHEGRHNVAWVAGDGQQALTLLQRDEPDLILLDLVMPGLDGVATAQQIRSRSRCPVVIVTASVERSSAQIFAAMGHGALDVVQVPPLTGPVADCGRELLHKLTTIERLRGQRPGRAATAAPQRPPLVAIGASTGGPKALAALLAPLAADTPAALVVVQHIDAQFAAGLAQWLDGLTSLPVQPAEPGLTPQAGRVFVSARNDHLVLQAGGRFAYRSDPRDEPYRPSVNVFFRSLLQHWPQPGLAALLTGMGRDGAAGLLELRRAGWHTIAQDEASCAVYGMPRAAAELGAACEVLSPEAIGRRIRGGWGPVASSGRCP